MIKPSLPSRNTGQNQNSGSGPHKAAAFVERDFGLPVVTYPRPCLGFLGKELHCDAVVRGYLGADSGRCDDSVAVPGGEVDPCAHLFPDAEDLGRGAIDAVFAVALTEQGRNQDAN